MDQKINVIEKEKFENGKKKPHLFILLSFYLLSISALLLSQTAALTLAPST
jgi:hypothetical protein